MATKEEHDGSAAKESADVFVDPNQIHHVMQLRDWSVLVKALSILRTQLIAAVKVRVDPTIPTTRVLVEYVQSCNDPSELVELWDYQNSANIQNLECLVPDVISLFIRLCDTPILRPFGLELCQTIMQRRIHYIYRGLSATSIAKCQSMFRILVAIASFSQTTTRELFQMFNFQTEGFLRASRYRQSKNSKNPNRFLYDLRTSFVKFVLAFFIHGDAEIKRQVLSIKGFAHGVFMHIHEDAYQLIEEILSVTYEHLIMDSLVPRSAKAFFFSPYILEKMAKIYARGETESIGGNETGVPADLVHHFLISICSVPGVGVCFPDAGWYPATALAEEETKSDKLHNRVLAKFIPSLKPTDDMRQQELLVKILAACPELVQGYWQKTFLTYEPRLSTKWLANVTLLQKITHLPVPPLYYGNDNTYPSEPPEAETILDNILPNVFGRSLSTKGLQHASALVRYTTLIGISVSFQKYGKVAEAMRHVISVLEKSQEYPGTNEAKLRQSITAWRRCLENVREGLRRRVPEIQILNAIYNQVTNKRDSATQQQQQQQDDAEIVAQYQMLEDAAFRLIRYYQAHLPEIIMESNIDPTHFIPVDLLSIRPGSLIHLLEFLLDLPDFQWSSKADKTSFTHITTLLTLYLQTPYKHIRDLTGRLINQTLADSFLFRHDAEEIDLWLAALPQNFVHHRHAQSLSMTEQQTAVLKFLDDCIGRFGKAQYKYTDQLVQLVTAADQTYLLAVEDRKRTLATSLSATLLGETEDMTDMGAYTHPFSPLLLTLFENLRFVKDHKRSVIAFLTKLIVLLQSKQKAPYYLLALCDRLRAMEDDEMATSNLDPHAIPQYKTAELIHQAEMCLKQCRLSPVSSAKRIETDAEANLEALLSQNNVEDVAAAQQQMVDILSVLPVSALDKHLLSVAENCQTKLGWTNFEPLVEYLSERHPLARSLFDYKEIQAIESLDDDHSCMVHLMKSIPFATLFHNAWIDDRFTPVVVSLLTHAIDTMSPRQLKHSLSCLLEHLAVALLTDTSISASLLKACFDLLRHGLTVSQANDEHASWRKLRSLVFDHPSIKEIFAILSSSVQQLEHGTHVERPFDALFLNLAHQYVDLLADAGNTTVLIESLLTLDYKGLRKDAGLFDDVSKLLVALVSELRRRSDTDATATLPPQTYGVIAEIWQYRQASNRLNNDVLPLLEYGFSRDNANLADHAASLSALLTTCAKPIVQYMLDGHTSSISLVALAEACQKANVDVAAMVEKKKPLPLTLSAVGIVRLGYDLLSEPTERDRYLQSTFEHILQQLTTEMDSSKMSDMEVVDDVYTAVSNLLDLEFHWRSLDAETVRDFILTALLDNINNAKAMTFVGDLVKAVYQEYTKVEPIETYLRRTLEHEQFQTLTASSLDETKEVVVPCDSAHRVAIIRLVHLLHFIQPTVLAEHYGLLDPILTSYSATTTLSDRRILEILMSTERHGQTSIMAKMLLWGPGSDKQRQTLAQAGTLLQASTISVETFGLIDPGLMKYTFTHFPADASLIVHDDAETVADETQVVTYDYRFFLPLFANLIASGVIDCRKFIECNGLGLVLVALSTTNEDTRKIGYQMMDQFYVMLDTAAFREKDQIVFLLDGLRNSITSRSEALVPPRIPAATCICVAHALSVILHPGHYMAPHVLKWLTQSSSFDLDYIPMFAPLFTSSSSGHKRERLWLLRVLSSSMRTFDDYQVFNRHRVWDVLGTFYNSVAADDTSKKAIIEIMLQATGIPDVAVELVKQNGLLAWIYQVLALSASSQERASWQTILKQTELGTKKANSRLSIR
ncbi:ribosome 60S biogenesis N-terminal-domain-containing protein [Radiomyces spectabilis]|uniref:ribosome 60S biogenesis N-terminal-domain-containing protein n=1 Tax=Radiomyces spectabilis TaxID=64574 RepID=UPI00221F560B|nr:ribosome 60S biogenesis N-terminal-domain-containing protein [Radiomyces spectabilis]KAI8388470.1 ribosome 60S biogenesis N-terminal-domain-containing protein [Radiomyces spectabilis]